MRRERLRGFLSGVACIGALVCLQLVNGKSSYDPRMGYVPSDLEDVTHWSDDKLRRELGLISNFSGNWRGDANYTLPQREAYSVLMNEIYRRERKE